MKTNDDHLGFLVFTHFLCVLPKKNGVFFFNTELSWCAVASHDIVEKEKLGPTT